MADGSSIRVLVADGSARTRDELSAVISSDPLLVVAGSAATGDEAISLTGKLKPDVMLIDIKIPGTSGVEVTEVISSLLPDTAVIMLSDEGGADLLRKAMIAGARQFLLKPLAQSELLKTIHQVHQTNVARRGIVAPTRATPDDPQPFVPAALPVRKGRLAVVYSPKGGVGCTTVAANVAVIMSHELKQRVALVDGSLTFGDISVFFDLAPSRTVYELVQVPPEQLDAEFVQGSLSHHRPSGLHILLAPPRPEQAEMISSEQLRRILSLLKTVNDYVIVDTSSSLDERMLTVMDMADVILLVFTLEITAIRAAKMFLDVAELLKFPPEKLLLVLTRAQSGQGIAIKDLEQTLGRGLNAEISSESRLIARSINRGEPVVLGDHNAQVSRDLVALTNTVVAALSNEASDAMTPRAAKPARSGRFRVFSR